MLPSVEDSITALFASTSFLDTLQFQETKGRIADQALAPAEVFEGQYIRDAHEHELGLFSTEDSSYTDGIHASNAGNGLLDHHSVHDRDDRARHRRSLLGRSTSGSTTSRSQHIASNAGGASNAWHFPKSRGPARIGAPDKATPLKKRRAQTAQNKSVVDPEAYLLAARKLLQTYPMQRASEHVELLYSQYEGLIDAIADLEESLNQPQPKASTSAMTIEASAEEDLAALETEIRREELEILALKEARRELDKEARQVDASRMRSGPSTQSQGPPPARTAPTKTAPSSVKTSTASSNPSRPPPAKAPMSATTSATTIGGRRVPDVVARRMAEQKAAAAAVSNRTSKTPSPPAVTPANHLSLNTSVPAVNVQSPSNTSMANDEDEDQTVVLSGRKGKDLASVTEDTQTHEEATASTPPPKRQLQPRLPVEQLDKVLAKIFSVLPGSVKKMTSKDAEAILSSLSSVISKAEAGSTSPTSSISASSAINASPTSSTLTPVNIIEFHLLYTFLSLLLSLEIEDNPSSSTGSKNKLNLILRRPLPAGAGGASSTGTPTSTSVSSAGDNAAAPPEAFLNMNNLKIYLGGKAKEKGLNEDLGHKAIYGLAAKRILKIDRKGREALVGFT